MPSERERLALERAVGAVAEEVAAAETLVDEALAIGPDAVAISAKTLRLEVLRVKGDLERELGRLVLDCIDCGRTLNWVSGVGAEPGHWGVTRTRSTRRTVVRQLAVGVACPKE
jgi:hypothetical protein